MNRALSFTFDYPPTVNHYWGQRGIRKFLTAKAKKFREHVAKRTHGLKHLPHFRKEVQLHMRVHLFTPDNRRRDIDNPLKPLLDALEYVGVLEDDAAIHVLEVYKIPKKTHLMESGHCVVEIKVAEKVGSDIEDVWNV